jgi:hypothetical protein
MKAHLSVFLLASVLSMGTVLAHDKGNGNGEAPRKQHRRENLLADQLADLADG